MSSRNHNQRSLRIRRMQEWNCSRRMLKLLRNHKQVLVLEHRGWQRRHSHNANPS
jgi:hypothetical protein